MGQVRWTLAQPGVRYGVLLVAVAAGLVGSAALLGHAVNAPALSAYQQAQTCGLQGSAADNCRLFVPGTVLSDRPYPLGIHALTLATEGSRAVYLGRAEEDRSAIGYGSEALLVLWRGRAARVIGQRLVLEPFTGPPGSAFLLIVVAILCELLCALALGLQGLAWRLRASVIPTSLPPPPSWPAGRPHVQLVFMGALVVALLAARTGHAAIAAPLHAACGLVAAGLMGAAGIGSARALAAVAGRRGMDGLSEEPALRLGSDVALAAVLVALCLSLAADLVVNDLLTLPR